MIDFHNADFFQLKKVATDAVGPNLLALLLPGEKIIGNYKGLRDYVVFTDRRIISVNVQGITGKKQDLTSLPYNKITVFSVETSGTLDIDCELELYFSGVGKVKFEFSGESDIIEIGHLISSFLLKA